MWKQKPVSELEKAMRFWFVITLVSALIGTAMTLIGCAPLEEPVAEEMHVPIPDPYWTPSPLPEVPSDVLFGPYWVVESVQQPEMYAVSSGAVEYSVSFVNGAPDWWQPGELVFLYGIHKLFYVEVCEAALLEELGDDGPWGAKKVNIVVGCSKGSKHEVEWDGPYGIQGTHPILLANPNGPLRQQ